MKNIEKYPNTKDALEAWRRYDGYALFTDWLQREYAAPREPTLLEAADKFLREYNRLGKHIGECALELAEAVAREKQQPVRNIDRFATAEEACEVFKRMCEHSDCDSCKYNRRYTVSKCIVAWLYAEADEAGKEAK